jgi:F0F1-type ATP synthase assembly protein I
MDKKQVKKEPKENRRQSLNALARYSGMAFQIGATVILCLYLGKWLDSKIKLSLNFPLFTTFLTILGVFLGVYFVIRDLLKNKKQ